MIDRTSLMLLPLFLNEVLICKKISHFGAKKKEADGDEEEDEEEDATRGERKKENVTETLDF
jgi:hypothetical protein